MDSAREEGCHSKTKLPGQRGRAGGGEDVKGVDQVHKGAGRKGKG